jgi:hypothetical protein
MTISGTPNDGEARLDELVRAYRASCQVAEAGPNFMPDLWDGIDERRVSANWFGRLARVLVTAALAASPILGIKTQQAAEKVSGRPKGLLHMCCKPLILRCGVGVFACAFAG